MSAQIPTFAPHNYLAVLENTIKTNQVMNGRGVTGKDFHERAPLFLLETRSTSRADSSEVPPLNEFAFALDHAFPEPVDVMPDCPVMVTEPPPWETVNTPDARAPVEFANISSEIVPGMWQTPPALSIGTGAELEY